MDCVTRVYTVTPLPKKRFQRLCLKKNTHSCPPKSVQSRNKENYDNSGVSPDKPICNKSERLSSPGYGLEHRLTPTFVTMRRPRKFIPSPLTTSGSILDSDNSQFVVSGYFGIRSPLVTRKPLLTFSTPVNNKVLDGPPNFANSDGMKTDKIEGGKNCISAESTNIQDLYAKTILADKITTACNESCNIDVSFADRANLSDNTTKYQMLESLKIFDNDFSLASNVADHSMKTSRKTPENSRSVERKLTPKTASIMDNLYGDVWKSTPGLFKKTKSRIVHSHKVENFSVDDDDVTNKLDLLNLNSDNKIKRRLSQCTITRFFKSSAESDHKVVAPDHKTSILHHFDKIDNVYILKDCLKDRLYEDKNNSIINNDLEIFTNDRLPSDGMNSDMYNPLYTGLYTIDDNILNAPGRNDIHVSPRGEIIDLTDNIFKKSTKSLINSYENNDNAVSLKLNDTDNIFIGKQKKIDAINNKIVMAKGIINGIKKCSDSKTDSRSKNISQASTRSTDGKKPRTRIVSESPVLLNIDKAIDRKFSSNKSIHGEQEKIRLHEVKPACSNVLIPLKTKILSLKEQRKEQKSKNDREIEELKLKKKTSHKINAKNVADADSSIQSKLTTDKSDDTYELKVITNIKNREILNDHKAATSTEKILDSNRETVSDKEGKLSRQKDIRSKDKIKVPLEKSNKIISKGDVGVKTKNHGKMKSIINKTSDARTKMTQQKNKESREAIKYNSDDSDLFDTLTNKGTVKINSNLDDSCQILTTNKKKMNYFPSSSDSDTDSRRKIDDLHFELKPKTLVFGSNGNESDSSKNAENYPIDNGVVKKPVKKSIKERNLNKSSTATRADVAVSNDIKVHGFMASLADNVASWRCDPEAKYFKLNFKSKRDVLTKKLFIMFNENVFQSKLPVDLPITWSVNLTKTAGCAHNKVIKHRSKPGGSVAVSRKSRVELSTKVLDGTQRLRDTLAHELCHVATWLIDGQLKDSHGPYWKSWVARTLKVYPELVSLPVCHTLDIHFKYTYKCVKCGYSIGRHSKSIDTVKKRCGYCYGTLECIHNKKNKDGLVVSTPIGQKRQATGFALYVKENYGNVRGANTPHKEAMKYLGVQYAKMKIGVQESTDEK